MQFLETNILSRFGCPEKIITDNAAAFKSKRMTNFCHKYHISLGHSSDYYPQGNGLAESSNKSLINIIKKVLEENKKNWHKTLWMPYGQTNCQPKDQKTPKKMTFLPFFGHTKAVLEESIVEGSNEIQMKKMKMF